jgi:hypothetical protein
MGNSITHIYIVRRRSRRQRVDVLTKMRFRDDMKLDLGFLRVSPERVHRGKHSLAGASLLDLTGIRIAIRDRNLCRRGTGDTLPPASALGPMGARVDFVDGGTQGLSPLGEIGGRRAVILLDRSPPSDRRASGLGIRARSALNRKHSN